MMYSDIMGPFDLEEPLNFSRAVIEHSEGCAKKTSEYNNTPMEFEQVKFVKELSEHLRVWCENQTIVIRDNFYRRKKDGEN